MKQCPKCACFMSYYIYNVSGRVAVGYRCPHCAYDLNNQHIIWSDSIPIETVEMKYVTSTTI